MGDDSFVFHRVPSAAVCVCVCGFGKQVLLFRKCVRNKVKNVVPKAPDEFGFVDEDRDKTIVSNSLRFAAVCNMILDFGRCPFTLR